MLPRTQGNSIGYRTQNYDKGDIFMRNTRTPRRLDGFTLIEMIIVIAIIGILLAVFVPTISGYYNKSRLNTANSNAKVVFNSAQTICQEFEFLDRNAARGIFYGSSRDANGIDHAVTTGEMMIRSTQGTITNAWLNGTENTTLLSTLVNGLNDPSRTPEQRRISSFQNRLDRLFANNHEVDWCLFIQDYSVEFVACATSGDSDAVGTFPRKSTDRGELFSSIDTIDYPAMSARVANIWG